MQEIEGSLAVIRRAIQEEIAGQRFYYDASFYCVDPWAKEVFAGLALEEESHAQLLLVEYDSLSRQGGWVDPNVALASGVAAAITQITFADDGPAQELFPAHRSADAVVDRGADDLDALAFGIRLEQQALVLYRDGALDSSDPAAQKAFQFLVEEETRHYHQLKEQWERLAGMPYVGM